MAITITTAAGIITTTVSTDTATTADRPGVCRCQEQPAAHVAAGHLRIVRGDDIDGAPNCNIVTPSADCQPIVTPPLSSLRIVPPPLERSGAVQPRSWGILQNVTSIIFQICLS
ncbi:MULTISPECIES: hypothetical protein [unclassified Bradyrhizobium]|uniref:hypothetical protein n=1 Tax=Bradyrhizobium TaxID=374 RepID=UPI0028EA2950|nr:MULTISPECIES: hypothetical protein [unclassified Bradyrhizobium]